MSVLGRGSRSMSLFREMQRQGLYLRPLSSQISPADVPENLIEQCQMVLQVIRHFQTSEDLFDYNTLLIIVCAAI